MKIILFDQFKLASIKDFQPFLAAKHTSGQAAAVKALPAFGVWQPTSCVALRQNALT